MFVNGIEIHKSKPKGSKINAIPLYLGSILNDFPADNMKKTGCYGYVYDFSVDYHAIAVDDTLYIQKFLMTKNDIK